jgi:DNA helicase HerA-like ATPase
MIGHFPGTNYPVTIDPDFLVTHNCAILGILGAGKSFLTLELAERIINRGIKVICLDLTNQYAQELAPYYDREAEGAAAERLRTIGAQGKNNAQRNVEEGGSIQQFAAALKEDLEAFLDPADGRRLKVCNPLSFEVWRQDSKPFENRASMASLTPTEITRIIAETTLEILQAQGMSDTAKCCLIFEEAHSLIPEWNAVASEGDKTATNGTAKAILQGRKYGLGCFVITQRTANVTKSILNQCNTVFALRVFDATGMEFLKNYIGEDYAAVLSTLEDRHAVVFGRASSCRNPVLIRLNDRDNFLRVFRPLEPAVNAVANEALAEALPNAVAEDAQQQ